MTGNGLPVLLGGFCYLRTEPGQLIPQASSLSATLK